MNKTLLSIALVALTFASSCSKTDTTTNPPVTSPSKSAATPSYTTGDGAIIAVMTRTSTTTLGTTYDVDLGTGVAVFGNLSTGTYTDAGNITLNGKALTKQTNNTYIYTPSVTDATGIDFGSNIDWMVTTPSFTYNAKSGNGKGMPSGAKMDGTFTSIDVNSDFTLSMTNAIGMADSVYFQITGTSKSIIKAKGGSEKSATFTSAELKTLGNTTAGSVVIAPWNHELKTFGGKQIHVINELALSKVITIK